MVLRNVPKSWVGGFPFVSAFCRLRDAFCFVAATASLVSVASCGTSSDTGGTSGGASGGSDGNGPGPGQQGSCSGWADECYRLAGIKSCYAQSGCFYNDAGRKCDGIQARCDAIGSSDTCVAQLGCTWTDAVGKTTTMNRAGTCVGTSVACEAIADEATCRAQPGLNRAACQWNTNRCERDYSQPTGCGAWNAEGLYPTIAEDGCTRTLNCEWQTP